MNKKFVAYYRVSTREQSFSHLGLEAQEAMVKKYCLGSDGNLIAAYTETETGKKNSLENRPILKKALAHCKRIGAILIIAKLDRLARSVYVTAMLHKSGIEFLCCDMPTANRMTVQILAAVAENEAKMISDRTKAALGALKARGVKLGSHRPECANTLTPVARKIGGSRSAKIKKIEKIDAYRDVINEIIALRKQGTPYKGIAKCLNDRGDTTRTGCDYLPSTIYKIIKLGKSFNNLELQIGV